MQIKTVLIILNVAALLASLIWLWTSQSWEPLVATIGLVGGLVALLFGGGGRGNGPKMDQRSGRGSSNYQSGGDINIKK